MPQTLAAPGAADATALVAALGINMAPYVEQGRRDERARLQALHRMGGSSALVADLEAEAGRV